MSESKYGHLVKPLEFRQGRGGANAKEMVFMRGEALADFNLNFIVGVYDEPGDWAPGRGSHAHPFDECLVFFGYDDDDLNYLGSELEISLGKELEKHAFSTPHVVIAPKGSSHLPLITRKVYQPFGHFHLALNPEYRAVSVKPEGATNGNKYSHWVKELPIQDGPGGANAKQQVMMTAEELEGLDVNFAIGLYKETGEWYPGKGAHVHPYDECMIFFGHDVINMSYLGAEITVSLGEEQETYTFDVPTVVILPRNLPHFPITCNKIDRPYGVLQVGLNPAYECSWV